MRSRQKNNIAQLYTPSCESLSRLFLLDRLQIFDQILQTDVAEILVFFDLVKDWAPDGHLTRAMSKQGRIVATNDLSG